MKCNFEKNKLKIIISIFLVSLLSLSFSHEISAKSSKQNRLDGFSSFLSVESIEDPDFEDLNMFADLENINVEEHKENKIKSKEKNNSDSSLKKDNIDLKIDNSNKSNKITFKANKSSVEKKKANELKNDNESIFLQKNEISMKEETNISKSKKYNMIMQKGTTNFKNFKHRYIPNKENTSSKIDARINEENNKLNSYVKEINNDHVPLTVVGGSKYITSNELTGKNDNLNDYNSNRNSEIQNLSTKIKSNQDFQKKNLENDDFFKDKDLIKNTFKNKVNKDIKTEHLPNVNNEKDKLFSQLDESFIQKLIKIQNNPNMKMILNDEAYKKVDKQTEENSKVYSQPISNNSYPEISFLKTREKINKNIIKNYYKPEDLDFSKIESENELINKLRHDIQKKTIDNDQLSGTNKQLEKSYDQLNNQMLVTQTKMDLIQNEINNYEKIKESYSNELGKIKEGDNLLNDMTDYFKKINTDINSKEDSIRNYEKKIQQDMKTFNDDKLKMENNFNKKNKELEDIKNSYKLTESYKTKLIEDIKKSYEGLSKEEINFFKLKSEENQLELEVKNEENAEKLIAMEIEHLKSLNMMEIQKIEELKQNIEKSKSLKDYLKNEVDELEEKLKNSENDNKQNQIEYELKKNELEDKLNNLKEEMRNEESLNKEEREKYQQIENDIKSKISYVSIHNTNSLGKNVDYILNKKLDNVPTRSQNTIQDNMNEGEKNKYQGLVNTFYSFKEKKNPHEKYDNDDNKLKAQILTLLKKLNE